MVAVRLDTVVEPRVDEPVVTKLTVLMRVEFKLVMVDEAEVVVAKVEVAVEDTPPVVVKVPETVKLVRVALVRVALLAFKLLVLVVVELVVLA